MIRWEDLLKKFCIIWLFFFKFQSITIKISRYVLLCYFCRHSNNDWFLSTNIPRKIYFYFWHFFSLDKAYHLFWEPPFYQLARWPRCQLRKWTCPRQTRWPWIRISEIIKCKLLCDGNVTIGISVGLDVLGFYFSQLFEKNPQDQPS